MLSLTDTNVSEVSSLFGEYGIECSFLVATETGMKKGIMDAVKPLRSFLKENNFHDYDTQEQGPAGKRLVESFFVTADELIPTTTSLYRPVSKSGDPRIWFYKLPKIASPENLLAVVIKDNILYILNCSDNSILSSIADNSSPLFEVLSLSKN